MSINIRRKVRVQNRKGHSYSGTGFLTHWKDEKGIKNDPDCARIGCDGTADCGGHVYIPGTGPHPHYYIVPLCSSCNQTVFPNGFFVYDDDMVNAPAQD